MDFEHFRTLGDIVGGWGQLIEAIGVIVSLLYLAKQIRDSTMATRASTYQELTQQITEITFTLSANEELAAFVQRVGFTENPLDDVDVLRWASYAYSVFRNLDNIYFHYTLGTLSRKRMDNLLRVALEFNLLWYPRMREYWKRMGPAFDVKFRRYVDGILHDVQAAAPLEAVMGKTSQAGLERKGS